MALPVDYDMVAVRGKYVYLNGTPVSGMLQFTGKVTATSAATRTIIIPAQITVPLDGGQFEVYLPATNDPDIQPNAWTYTVQEMFNGGRSYEIDVPISAKNGGIDLSLIAPAAGDEGDPTAFVTLTAFQASLGNAVADSASALSAAQQATTTVQQASTAAQQATTAAQQATTTAQQASTAAQQASTAAQQASTAAQQVAVDVALARGGIVNVVGYGAKGDAATINDAAISAALGAVPAQGGVLYFPRGTYHISAPIAVRSQLTIRGEGRSATRIVQTNADSDGIANTSTGLQYLTIEDIDVRCVAATGTGIGVNIGSNTAASSYLVMSRVNVQGFGGTGVYLGRWIASTVTDVRSQGHGGHGFHLDRGTSYTLSGCYALSCQQAGYRLSGSPLNYTTLLGTATDACGIGYELVNVSGVTLVGTGNESGVNRSPQYPGTGIRIDGGSAIGIYNHLAYGNTAVGLHVSGGAVCVTVVGYRDNSPTAGAGATSIRTDAATRSIIMDPRLDGVSDYASGTVVAINSGSRSELFAAGSTSVLRATTNTAGATNTQPVIQVIGTDAANRAVGAQLGADTSARWMVDVAGRTEWGSGAAARDVVLYRKGADLLATDDAVFLANLGAEPGTSTGGGVLYVQAGSLKFKGSSGTVTTLGPA